jgi:tetratricopeptide (TPR) repeat protein
MDGNHVDRGWIKQMSADFFKQLSVNTGLIRILRLAPFLLILSTVFVVGNDIANSIVSGKYFWFYGSMGLTGLATLIRTLTGKHPFRFSMMDLLAALFAVAVYLPACLLNAAAPNTTKLTILTLLVALYFCFRLIFSTLDRKDFARRLFCLFIILTALVEAVWGLRQLYGFMPSQHHLFKLTGSFFNPGPYAGYLAMVMPLAVYLGVKGKGFIVKGIAFTTCTAILPVLPAAMSRAAWLAAIAGCAVVIYKKYENQLQIKRYYAGYKKRIWLGCCLIVFIFLIALAGLYSLKKDSADGRLLTWKISLQTVMKHPLGAGLGNFSGAYGDTQAAYFASGKASETEEHVAGNPEYGFNEYLQILIESGIVAFLLFSVIVVLAVRSLLKTNAGMAGSLVALLVFACFSYPFSVLPFLIVFVFLTARSADDADQKDLRKFLNDSPKGKIRVNLHHLSAGILALCCLLITVFCLWKQYPVYQAYKQWKNNQIYYHAGLYKDTAKSYEKLYPYLNDQIRFLFEYAQCLSKSDQPEKSNTVLRRAVQISCDPMLYNIMGKNYKAMKQYEEAEAVLIKSVQLVPGRLYPWYLLTKLYLEMGLEEKAAETAKIVLTKEPKVQSPAVREMREEVGKLKTKN